MTTDPRVDAFIAMAAPFAQPILEHLRALVHREQPTVVETIKWGMPFFMLNGRNLCGMAAFKAHCAFIVEDAGSRGGEGMGHFGKVRSLDELPDDAVLVQLIAKRAEALLAGAKKPAKPRQAKAELPMPGDLIAALCASGKAHLEAMSPSQQRDYAEWITSAKRPETRVKRIAEAAEWLTEGKKRNWKYESCHTKVR